MLMPASISSIQRTQGATDSAVRMEICKASTVFLQVDGENGLSFLKLGEGDEKNQVKTTFSQDLWGKEFDDVGCRGNKDESAFFLHPGKEGGKDPRLSSPSGFLALNADACFNLVNPEHTRRHGFRGSNGDLQGLFRFSNRSIIEPGHVEVEQRDLPERGKYLSAEAFTTS